MKLSLTPEQALIKIRNWCARQERNHSEVRNKLYHFGLKRKEVENIIAELISNGFINEERFAKQYSGGKFRMKKWGRMKIQNHLKQKKVSEYCINKGLQEITEKEYRETLKKLIEKKSKTIQEKNPLIKKNKLARFLIGKGYEPELVWEFVNDYFC